MNTPNNKINETLLRKYFNNECNSKEKEEVLHYFNDPQYENRLKKVLRKHWNEYNADSEKDIDTYRILGKIYHEILSEKEHITGTKAKLRRFTNWYYKIAAAILIPLLIAGGLYVAVNENLFGTRHVEYAEIYSPAGGRIHLELPDGSSVWLNSNARLKYPALFSGKSRKVLLTGEGYFDVTKNPERPFIVQTGKYEVRVLGTSFNVCNEFDQPEMAVTLVEGKVAVCKKENNRWEKITELKPEERLAIQKANGKFSKTRVDTEKYTGWIEGKLIFRNDPFTEVIQKLEKWYNVDIELKDKELETYRFRATFQHESLDEVLKLIKLTSPIDYKEVKRTMKQDGTYAKKKIIFYKAE